MPLKLTFGIGALSCKIMRCEREGEMRGREMEQKKEQYVLARACVVVYEGGV